MRPAAFSRWFSGISCLVSCLDRCDINDRSDLDALRFLFCILYVATVSTHQTSYPVVVGERLGYSAIRIVLFLPRFSGANYLPGRPAVPTFVTFFKDGGDVDKATD